MGIVQLLKIITVIPLFLLTITIFFVYRQTARLLLFLRHPCRFGGLLGAYDAVHAVKDAEKHLVCVLFLIRHPGGNFYHHARQHLLAKLKAYSRTHSKAFSLLRSCFMGYSYLLKEGADVDEHLKKMQGSKEDLMRMVSECSEQPLPKNGEALWDLFIGAHPVKVQYEELYPVLLRFNHVLSDGESIVKTILGGFADREQHIKEISKEKLLLKRYRPEKFLINIYRRFVNVFAALRRISVFFMVPLMIFDQFTRLKDDKNALHGSALVDERIFAMKIEESPQYFQMVKKIKNRVPQCTFSDVVLTALSASLEEYFSERLEPVPNSITVAFPESPRTVKLSLITPGTRLSSSSYCRNHLTFSINKLFISTGFKITLVKRLKKIMGGNRHDSHLDLEMGHWTQKLLFGLSPSCVSDWVMKKTKVTMIVSNLPGPPAISVFGGSKVENMLLFGAHRDRTGVILVIFTYGGRLNMTLNINKALVREDGEVQRILDNVYKYLDLLAEEIGVLTRNGMCDV